MYFAKKKGRNCYSYFNKTMQEEAQYKTSLTRDLKKAIRKQQFTLHYQPIIELATNKINKAEALIRWNHPERGLVSPVEFIPLAEEVGVINEIGDWTFKEAIDHTADIQSLFKNDFKMTINTSPLQYRKNGMNVSSWFDYLHSHGLSGDNIIVEITEGVLMEATESVIQRLFQLRDLNVGVAIDDFGTGYSSLSYLKKFDIDYLKIDRSFVQNLAVDSDDLVLIQAIIVMAHQLGIKVVAEGIETRTQKELLVAAGCDFGQGFYFSKPVDANSFIELLQHWEKKQSSKQKSKP
jgi:EAL domain-containing protein (putative c-di-GMP-specific phosphodiesterase class I)